jgi:hypothetical protein
VTNRDSHAASLTDDRASLWPRGIGRAAGAGEPSFGRSCRASPRRSDARKIHRAIRGGTNESFGREIYPLGDVDGDKLCDWLVAREIEKELGNATLQLLATMTEVRICTMLRMNLKSHEMAQVFCITEPGIEFHRRNIRGKLKLQREERLPIVLGAM